MAKKTDFRKDSQVFKVFSELGFPEITCWKKKEIDIKADELGVSRKFIDQYLHPKAKVGHGTYDFSYLISGVSNVPSPQLTTKPSMVQSLMDEHVNIPDVDSSYISWGWFNDVVKIIKSKEFFPTFISGLSGNGKTMMVEQACAKLGREYVRVQISPETDEDSLIGGFRLVNGETVFSKGPVIKAMERGAILLIDEIDRATNRIMCLQGVLEGKPVMIKRTGEVVKPTSGFNVIATANTKGQGSDDGKFVAATIIDEAFLERFVITLEQPYPSQSYEKKIVLSHMDKYGCVDEAFAELLTMWSNVIRSTYEEGGVDEIVSTRRLCHIVKTFSIFKDRLKSIKLCMARFDQENQDAFIDLYTKVDSSINGDDTQPGPTVDDVLDDVIDSNSL